MICALAIAAWRSRWDVRLGLDQSRELQTWAITRSHFSGPGKAHLCRGIFPSNQKWRGWGIPPLYAQISRTLTSLVYFKPRIFS
jgi:hypothetical protein